MAKIRYSSIAAVARDKNSLHMYEWDINTEYHYSKFLANFTAETMNASVSDVLWSTNHLEIHSYDIPA